MATRGPGGSTTAVDDFNLTARDVELRATEGRCDVESNGLHTDKVSVFHTDKVSVFCCESNAG